MSHDERLTLGLAGSRQPLISTLTSVEYVPTQLDGFGILLVALGA